MSTSFTFFLEFAAELFGKVSPGMKVALVSGFVVAIAWIVLSVLFVLFMCVSLVNDERHRVSSGESLLSNEQSFGVMMTKIIIALVIAVPVCALVAGALSFGLVYGVSWIAQHPPLDIIVAGSVAVVACVCFVVRRQVDTV
jgi:hypothetical protein